MKPIRFSDNATIIGIVESVKLDVAKRFPDLQPGSEAFNKKVAYYAEEVVLRTQHGYDPVTKTPLQRSNNPLVRGVFLFTGQLQKQYNLMSEAWYVYLNNPTAKNFATFRNYLVNVGIYNSFWVAAVTLLNMQISGYRKKDDEDAIKDLFIGAGREFMGNFPVMGAIGAGIWSRLDEYQWRNNIDNPALDLINQSMDAVADFYNAASLEDNAEAREKFVRGADKTMKVAIQGMGLPFKIYTMIDPLGTAK
jgi:hypothetical protein